MQHLGKMLLVGGLAIAALGLFLWLGPRIPGLERIGRLPGDIHFRGERVSFYFPVVTCLLLSLLLTLLFRLFR